MVQPRMVALSPVLLAVGGGTPFLALDLTQAEGTWGPLAGPAPQSPHHALSWLQGAHGPESPHLLLHGPDREGQSLLQTLHPLTNQKIRKTFVQRNMFEFKHIKAFDRVFADSPGPYGVAWVQLWGQGWAGSSTRLRLAVVGCTACLLLPWEDGRAEGSEGRGSIFCPDCPHLPRSWFATPGMLHAGQSLQIFRKGREREEHGEVGLVPGLAPLGAGGCPG